MDRSEGVIDMSESERGGEIVQFVIATPLFLALLFSCVQVACTMFSTQLVSSEVVQACLQMDTGGLTIAPDKEAFVKSQIIGSSTQLVAKNLSVKDVKIAPRKTRASRRAGGGETLSSNTAGTDFSCEISYRVPGIFACVGMPQTLSRQVVWTSVDERVIEARAL